MINEKTMNAGNESDPHKGQVLWSFLTIDVVGPGNLRGSFLYGEKKKTNLLHFIITSEFTYNKVFVFCILTMVIYIYIYIKYNKTN